MLLCVEGKAGGGSSGVSSGGMLAWLRREWRMESEEDARAEVMKGMMW